MKGNFLKLSHFYLSTTDLQTHKDDKWSMNTKCWYWLSWKMYDGVYTVCDSGNTRAMKRVIVISTSMKTKQEIQNIWKLTHKLSFSSFLPLFYLPCFLSPNITAGMPVNLKQLDNLSFDSTKYRPGTVNQSDLPAASWKLDSWYLIYVLQTMEAISSINHPILAAKLRRCLIECN